jgi:hypothetical protein
MTQPTSEIMKLNFITDQGSILDRMSCALRVDCGPLGATLAAAAFLGFACLAASGFARAWNWAVTLAAIGLEDLSSGRAD